MLKFFRTQPLQSLLLIFAFALAMSLVTTITAFLFLTYQNSVLSSGTLAARELSLSVSESSAAAFVQDGTLTGIAKIGKADLPEPEFSLADLATAKAAAPAVSYGYTNEYLALFKPDWDYKDRIGAHAITPEFTDAARLKLLSGSLFTERDYKEGKQLLVLTPKAAEKLELGDMPIGKTVLLTAYMGNQAEYTVVGMVEPWSDNEVFALTPLNISEPEKPISGIIFAVDDATKLNEARAQLQDFANKTWGDNRITVESKSAFYSILEKDSRQSRWLIAIFASVGAVAASLNIMNLLLARVLKQHRNIGILRSLGASQSHIIWHYLKQSLLLSALGALLGIPASQLLITFYNRYLESTNNQLSVRLYLAPDTIIVGLVVALLFSLVFSFYPAWAASRLKIIDALREA